MDEQKYIVIVNGVLKFRNGKKVLSGGFIPEGTSKDEIEDKLERKQIALFDNELSAMVQSANVNNADIAAELKKEIKELKSEIKKLKAENKELKELIDPVEKNQGGKK